MKKLQLKSELEKIGEYIESKRRGGHNYNSYYGDDMVCYANIKNYDFADRDEIADKLPKKYKPYFENISNETISDMEWNERNFEIEGIKDFGVFSEEYPNIELVGCFGSSGGWYGVTVAEGWQKDIDTMVDDLDRKPDERSYTIDDMKYAVKAWNQVQQCIIELEQQADGWDGSEAVYYMLEANYFDEWQADIDKKNDIAKARKLAKKHGYILAQEVTK